MVPHGVLGSPRSAHRGAAGAGEGGGRRHQRRVFRGSLRSHGAPLVCGGSAGGLRAGRPLAAARWHHVSEPRASGDPARRAEPGEAEEVHDPHRRVQRPVPAASAGAAGLLSVRTSAPQPLGEQLDPPALPGIQHPLLPPRETLVHPSLPEHLLSHRLTSVWFL